MKTMHFSKVTTGNYKTSMEELYFIKEDNLLYYFNTQNLFVS
jgi:hypothetical protein